MPFGKSETEADTESETETDSESVPALGRDSRPSMLRLPPMRRVIVQYRVKPDRVTEHETLIRGVFDELEKKTPPGIRYGAFKQSDGVSFVHIAFVEADKNPLDALDAFKAFTENIKDRCDQLPTTTVLSDVRTYGL
jgi:hypothetical protein